jgi:hypothetical protein
MNAPYMQQNTSDLLRQKKCVCSLDSVKKITQQTKFKKSGLDELNKNRYFLEMVHLNLLFQ